VFIAYLRNAREAPGRSGVIETIGAVRSLPPELCGRATYGVPSLWSAVPNLRIAAVGRVVVVYPSGRFRRTFGSRSSVNR